MEHNGHSVQQPASSEPATTGVRWHRPLGVFLGSMITSAAQRRFRVEVYGEEQLRHAPGALVLSNHRRDSDGPIIGGILLRGEAPGHGGVVPFFVTREDLFRRGFLGHYLETWPRPVRMLLNRLSVAPVLRVLQLRPMRRIPEHTLGELLPDVLATVGDLPLHAVLREPWAGRLAQQLGRSAQEMSVAHALRAPREVLHERHAFRKLTLDALRALKPFERQTIAAQLQVFVELLEAGETVVLEPEGTVSPDGRFLRPRGALHHLLNAPARTPHVLPVALSYDFLCLGRPRVLVRFGRPRHGLTGLSRRETDVAAQRSVLAQWTVNGSHLTAHYLRQYAAVRPGAGMEQDLERFVAAVAARCQRLQIPLDPVLLDRSARARRVAECVAFWRRGRAAAVVPGVQADTLLEYLHNELDAITAIHPRLLPDTSR